MAQYPTFGVQSPESAAQYGRGARMKAISEGLGGVAKGVMGVANYLNDKAKKQELVDEIIRRFPSAQPYRDRLMQMEPTELGEKTYVLKTLDEKNRALKAKFADASTPDPFQTALNMPIDRLNDYDNLLKTTESTISNRMAASQFKAGQTAPEYAAATIAQPGGEQVVPGETFKTLSGTLTAQQRAEAAGTPRPMSAGQEANLGMEAERLAMAKRQEIEDAEMKKTDLMKKVEAQWDAARAVEKDYQAWKKKTENSLETGVAFSDKKDKEWQSRIRAEKDRAIEFESQRNRQVEFIRDLKGEVKKIAKDEEKKGAPVGRFRVKVR